MDFLFCQRYLKESKKDLLKRKIQSFFNVRKACKNELCSDLTIISRAYFTELHFQKSFP